MKMLRSLALIFALLPAPVVAQQFPVVPDKTVIGRVGTGTSSGPSQAIPFTTLRSFLSIPADPILYATSFGVKCDGTSNDTTAIASAFAGAATKVLEFPPGTCLTDPQMMSGVYINVGTFVSGSAVITGLPSTTNLAVGNPAFGFSEVHATTTTSTSNIITLDSFGSTARYSVGMSVTGTGIPANTTITSIDTNLQMHISNNATASGTPNLTYANTSIPLTTIKSIDSATQVTLNTNATGSGTQQIQFSPNNVPQAIIAYGTTFKARGSSSSPTLTIEDVHAIVNEFMIAGLKIDANNLHAEPFKIHGGQHFLLQDMETINGTAGGTWLSGEPQRGIFFATLQNFRSGNNTGPAFIMKSINNNGNYYIGANNLTGLKGQNSTTFGVDADYASVGFYGSDFEQNGTCGFNINNAIEFDVISTHIEANNGTACAFTGTANTKNLHVVGGRTIGTISSSLLSDVSNVFATGDSGGSPITWFAGVNFGSGGLGFGTSLGLASAINTASGLSIALTGSTKAIFGNGLQMGSPSGGDEGTGTINLAGNLFDNGTAPTGTSGYVRSTAPTFNTSITDPLVIGGTGAASSLELRATSGVGVGSEAVKMTVGSNGAVTALTVGLNPNLTSVGRFGFGLSPAATIDMRLAGSDPFIDQFRAGLVARTSNTAGAAGMAFLNDGATNVGTSAGIQFALNSDTPALKTAGFLSVSTQTTANASYASDVAIGQYVSGSPKTNFYLTKTGGIVLASGTTAGSVPAITLTQGEIGAAKIAASGSAPGAGFAKLAIQAGTTGGTCKLVMYAGTSTTPTTVIDNVGSGC